MNAQNHSILQSTPPLPKEEGGNEPANSPIPLPDNIEIFPEVEIGTGGGRSLHAYIARPQQNPDQPMPAVLWIHGGGWSLGTHRGGLSTFLAADGYFTASIEYRLSGEAQWPAQIEDCKLAVRWLRANAKKYHVDPNHIGAWGHSAGGHLASCLGTMDDQPHLEGTGGYPGVSSKVQAVVNYAGPTDFTTGSYRMTSIELAEKQEGLLQLFGAPFTTHAALWKQGSPICYVHASNPPFLVLHGDQDLPVPIAQGEKLVAALEQAGVPVEFIRVCGGNHHFYGPPGSQNERFLNASVLAFFDKHLKRRV